jgi:PAS domain S-box-containing protein
MTSEQPSDQVSNSALTLRQRAEKKSQQIPKNLAAATLEGALQLLHELQVHQIELEMQNEELRRTQLKLEASRARYFDLYDLAPVGYFTLDDKGMILEANLFTARLLRVERQSLVAKPLTSFILPEDQDIHYRHRQQLQETGSPQVFEIRMLRAEAPPFWARLEMVTGADTDGAFSRRVVMSDINDRKCAEEALRHAYGALEQRVIERTLELEASNEELRRQIDERTRALQAKAQSDTQLQQAQKMEAVGLLAGGIAHDFGNILACIVGNNYFLLEGLKPGHPLRPYCLEIKRSSEVAATLTHQLLGVSGNRGVNQNSVLDPNSVIMAMAKMLRRLLGDNIQIDLDLHPAVWSVKMDSGQLEQIVMNLAVNARDAMVQGGLLTIVSKNLLVKNGADSLDPTALAPGRYVALEFRDTGIGMDAAVLSRLFEPFFTTKGPGRGTGLGLSTAKSIIQEYHGSISVESEPGRGSVFRVYLPSVKGGAEAMLRGPAVKKSKRGHEAVMVVEDNGSLIDILKLTLEGGGYSVFPMDSAEKALSQTGKIKKRIDILLTDVVLPGMDGVDLAKRLKELWPGLRVVYMSGYPGNALAPIAGFGDCVFLEKPFSPRQLLDTLRKVLDTSQVGLF